MPSVNRVRVGGRVGEWAGWEEGGECEQRMCFRGCHDKFERFGARWVVSGTDHAQPTGLDWKTARCGQCATSIAIARAYGAHSELVWS
jgi:hypothetical protein